MEPLAEASKEGVQSQNRGGSRVGMVREGSVGNLGFKRFLGRREGSLRVDGRGRYSVAKYMVC